MSEPGDEVWTEKRAVTEVVGAVGAVVGTGKSGVGDVTEVGTEIGAVVGVGPATVIAARHVTGEKGRHYPGNFR